MARLVAARAREEGKRLASDRSSLRKGGQSADSEQYQSYAPGNRGSRRSARFQQKRLTDGYSERMICCSFDLCQFDLKSRKNRMRVEFVRDACAYRYWYTAPSRRICGLGGANSGLGVPIDWELSISEATSAQGSAPPSEPANSVFAGQGERPNGPLDHVVADLDAAVLEKEAQPCPAR